MSRVNKALGSKFTKKNFCKRVNILLNFQRFQVAGLRQLENLSGGVGLEKETQPQLLVGQDRGSRKAVFESLIFFPIFEFVPFFSKHKKIKIFLNDGLPLSTSKIWRLNDCFKIIIIIMLCYVFSTKADRVISIIKCPKIFVTLF
jgi:hypothetical protein